MKTILSIFFLFVLSSVLITANAADNTNKNTQTISGSEQITDAQILDALMILSQNEIQLSQEALIRSQTHSVRKYAQTLKKDYTKILQKISTLSKKMRLAPKLSDVSSTLHEEGKTSLQLLKEDPNENFNNDYINTMVKDHKEALDIINNTLLPNVSDLTLKRYLMSTKTEITRHFKMAIKIQKTLAQES